ncbi:hypothetical protein R6Q57_017295 [Mikania cordata]
MEELNKNDQELKNLATINTLYKSLAAGDTKAVSGLLATHLEWWFHGPQSCQYMMRMLTGDAPHTEFRFEPRGITTLDDHIVVVEGYEGANVYWVHVWLLKDGLITRFREYFNTWLTVKKLRIRPDGLPIGRVGKDNWSTVWRSQPRDLFRRSLPGLMLAI